MKTKKKTGVDIKTVGIVKNIMIILIVVALLAAAGMVTFHVINNRKEEVDVVTVSTLQEIINVSELSTFTAVYNGIAEVNNADDPEKIDYYVSYEAKVDAGIDFSKVGISIDEDNKTVELSLPAVYITDTTVDIASLDYIFMNDAANQSTVSEQALKACEQDVESESQRQEAIVDLAQENAENVLIALVSPFIEQSYPDYEIQVV